MVLTFFLSVLSKNVWIVICKLGILTIFFPQNFSPQSFFLNKLNKKVWIVKLKFTSTLWRKQAFMQKLSQPSEQNYFSKHIVYFHWFTTIYMFYFLETLHEILQSKIQMVNKVAF